MPELFKNPEPEGFLGPKPRPLAAKLELFLDLLCRRICFDPSEPGCTEWSAERCLRTLKKQDHDMGN